MFDADDALISAWVDGRLSEAERAGFEARLSREPELRRRALATRVVVQQARRLPQVAPPRHFFIQPTAAAQPKPDAPTPRRSAQRFMRWAAALMAAAFVSLLMVDALRPYETLPPAQPAMLVQPMATPPEASLPDAQERGGAAEPSMQALAAPKEAQTAPTMPPPAAPAPLHPLRVGAGLALALALVLTLLAWRR